MTDADSRVASGSAGGGRPGGGRDDKGLGTHLTELRALVVAYAKQETVDPLKSLGRYILWGVIGAVLFAAGGALLTITAVRVVQAETGSHLHGKYSWVPYLGGMVVAGAGALWAGLRIVRGDKAVGGGRS